MWSLKHIKVFLLILKSYSFFSLQFDDCIKATEFHEVSRSLILLQIYINMNNQSFCLSPCHSLSEQITPAANFAAALWQLTVLWYWHWLRAISFPMHFTPLITMSVTLLLSQYQVSLKRYNKTGTRAKTKKTRCVDQDKIIRRLLQSSVRYYVLKNRCSWLIFGPWMRTQCNADFMTTLFRC